MRGWKQRRDCNGRATTRTILENFICTAVCGNGRFADREYRSFLSNTILRWKSYPPNSRCDLRRDGAWTNTTQESKRPAISLRCAAVKRSISRLKIGRAHV